MFNQSDKYVFPVMKQLNLASGRVYLVDEDGPYKGLLLPSITRVLKAKEKPELEKWKARVGEEEAARVSYIATLRGNKLHNLAELYLKNIPLPKIEPFEGILWQYLQPWLLKHVNTVYGSEIKVYSTKLDTAGSFDLLADVDGMLTIVDFKQANKPKKEEYVLDYKLQGTFYALAAYERTGAKVKQIAIPITSPEGTVVYRTEPRLHYNELLERIALFYQNYEVPSEDEVKDAKENVDSVSTVETN